MLGGLLHGSGNSGPLLPVGLSPEESAWQEELCSICVDSTDVHGHRYGRCKSLWPGNAGRVPVYVLICSVGKTHSLRESVRLTHFNLPTYNRLEARDELVQLLGCRSIRNLQDERAELCRVLRNGLGLHQVA